jgi:hypothetical protein
MDESCPVRYWTDEDLEVELGRFSFFAGEKDAPISESVLIEPAACGGVVRNAFAEDVPGQAEGIVGVFHTIMYHPPPYFSEWQF